MPDTMIVKSFESFEIKDSDKGIVEAIVATVGVVDKDEDIIRPDAIADGSKVSMSAYGHDLMGDFFGGSSAGPVGKGTLSVEKNKVVFKGRLFLATQRGRDTFETLKEMGADQQWSFGFRILGAEVPSEEERKQGARRILTKLDAFEVSPVIIGAGVGTRTTSVKSAEVSLPDPAIEAARIEAERVRLETERKSRELADANARAERMFNRGLPAGVR